MQAKWGTASRPTKSQPMESRTSCLSNLTGPAPLFPSRMRPKCTPLLPYTPTPTPGIFMYRSKNIFRKKQQTKALGGHRAIRRIIGPTQRTTRSYGGCSKSPYVDRCSRTGCVWSLRCVVPAFKDNKVGFISSRISSAPIC